MPEWVAAHLERYARLFCEEWIWQSPEAAPLPGYLIWAAIYCVLALVGVAIAGLFHFALKKEG